MRVSDRWIFVISFSAYVAVHAIRTAYSYSKPKLKSILQQDSTMMGTSILILGVVDSTMLVFLGIGHFMHAIYPIQRPVLSLWLALIACSVDYAAIPFFLQGLQIKIYPLLLGFMAINGFLQSYTWPNLLMIIHSRYNPKDHPVQLGFWASNVNFGNILGYLICEVLVARLGWNWGVGMYGVAVFTIINAIIVMIFVKQLQVPSNELIKSLTGSSHKSQYRGSLVGESQAFPTILDVLKDFNILFLTLGFALIKSVIYGIMLWLPNYFESKGFANEKATIPIVYDASSIVGSFFLGFAFRKATMKGVLLAPLMLILAILFALLRFIPQMHISFYYVMIGLVGVSLGGCFNTMAGLITIDLTRVVPQQYRSKCLGFFSALLMAFANIVTALTQILIGFVIKSNNELIFIVFFIYAVAALLCFIGVTGLEIRAFYQARNMLPEQEAEAQ